MAAKRKTRSYGEGSIYQKENGRWECALRINGKLVRRSSTRRAAVEEALQELLAEREITKEHVSRIHGLRNVIELWVQRIPEGDQPRYRTMIETRLRPVLDDLERMERQNVDVSRAMQTIDEWINWWFRQIELQKNLKPLTIKLYEWFIQKQILPILTGRALYQINASVVQALVNDIRTDILEASNGRYTGARSAQIAYRILNTSLTVAYDQGIYERHPCQGVIVPQAAADPIHAFTDDEVRGLLLATTKDARPALWECYVLTGMRRGEGIGLAWPHIDWEARTLRIEQQVIQGRGVLQLGAPKTKSSRRKLPLTDRLYTTFRTLYENTPPAERMGLIFKNREGGLLSPSLISEQFYRYSEVAKLSPDATLHHSRHTYATLLDEVDASEAIKAGILGHGKKNVTQHYTESRVDAMRRAMSAVEARIFAEKVKEETG